MQLQQQCRHSGHCMRQAARHLLRAASLVSQKSYHTRVASAQRLPGAVCLSAVSSSRRDTPRQAASSSMAEPLPKRAKLQGAGEDQVNSDPSNPQQSHGHACSASQSTRITSANRPSLVLKHAHARLCSCTPVLVLSSR